MAAENSLRWDGYGDGSPPGLSYRAAEATPEDLRMDRHKDQTPTMGQSCCWGSVKWGGHMELGGMWIRSEKEEQGNLGSSAAVSREME